MHALQPFAPAMERITSSLVPAVRPLTLGHTLRSFHHARHHAVKRTRCADHLPGCRQEYGNGYSGKQDQPGYCGLSDRLEELRTSQVHFQQLPLPHVHSYYHTSVIPRD